MVTVEELFDTIDESIETSIDELLVIDPNTRQISLPSSELIFGVESDTHSERKYFLCPRIVGNNVDLASCFIRINYRNANGDIDAYLVNDVTVVGDNVMFSWELSKTVTLYKGQTTFVVCACSPDGKNVEWHTTQSTGIVLAGLEPDTEEVEVQTADVVAQLLSVVTKQTEMVKTEGSTQVSVVQSTGAAERESIQTTAEATKLATVAEIEAKGTNTLATIPDDYTALGEAVGAIERKTAPGIVCEAEGESVRVSDASDNYIQNLRIFGKSTQDGIPTPDAPVEIESVENPVVTVCGKNLVDYTAGVASKYITKYETLRDGIHMEGNYYTSFPVNIVGGKSYTMRCDVRNASGNTNNVGGWCVVYEDGTLEPMVRNGTTIDAKYNGNKVYLYLNTSQDETGSADLFNIQLEVGSSSTEYEVYHTIQTAELTHTLHGIPVTSGGNYTDSNGQQWICDEVDLERGVYVQRVANRQILSTDNWVELSTEGRYWLIENAFYNVNASAFCTHFERANSWLNHTLDDGSFVVHRDPSWKDGRLSFKVDSITSLTAWKQFLGDNDVYVVYEADTPIETPLTETEIAAYRVLHTNKPNTTILNDAGAWMNVEYVADTKLYIDNKIATLLSGK